MRWSENVINFKKKKKQLNILLIKLNTLNKFMPQNQASKINGNYKN